jgi:hypothetical protein
MQILVCEPSLALMGLLEVFFFAAMFGYPFITTHAIEKFTLRLIANLQGHRHLLCNFNTISCCGDERELGF